MGKGEREREREQLRQERVASERTDAKSGRTRLIVGYAIASTVVLAVAVAIFIIASGGDASASGDSHINLNTSVGSTNGISPDDRAGTPPPPVQIADLAAAAKKAGCDLRLKLPDEGHAHIPAGSPTPNYRTDPPTSGNHVEPPFQQADGAYSETPAAIDYVHSLEHGRLEIQYAPDLPEKDQRALKGLYDTMYGATLLFPNDKMTKYKVAATTWTNLLGCPSYKGAATLDAIRAFGKATWGKYGGESARVFTFSGPTPAKPN
jgi:hypothetical protein